MKPKPHILLAIASTLGASVAFAAEERPSNLLRDPETPPKSPGLEREHRSEAEKREDAERSEDDRPPERRRPSASKPVPFLGVASGPVTPALGAQLGLPEGFGLVVEEVLPDSPAGRAGILRHDVLKRFNDQQLTDPNQLAALVRAQGIGAEIAITLLRQGKEQGVSLKLGERTVPERRSFPLRSERDREERGVPEGLKEAENRIRELTERLQKEGSEVGRKGIHEFSRRLQEFQERLREWQKNPKGEIPQPPVFKQTEPGGILREVRPGGTSEFRLLQPNSATTHHTANARVIIKDDDGTIEIGVSNGKRRLTAKNAEGDIVFNGPIDTAEQRKALPEAIRRKIANIEVNTSTVPPAHPDRGDDQPPREGR